MSAIISPCGTYRYTLERSWSPDPRYLMFVMINPSTADAENDDPTIRRCRGFARILGYDGILVGNLYAYRATKPKDLRGKTREQLIGPDNDRHLMELASRAQQVICAWGKTGPIVDRPREVCRLLATTLYALGLTKHGHPRHPLMLPNSARPSHYA